MLKLDILSSASRTALRYENIDRKSDDQLFSVRNHNTLVNGTYQNDFGDNRNWQFKSGVSYSYNLDNLIYDSLSARQPIIDWASWQLVQRKMKKPSKQRTVIDDEIPLRGLLRCHCGQPLTGAASRGKSGKYFYYYKCKLTGHNNISATKAHEQLLAALSLMSLSDARLKSVKNSCQQTIDKQRQSNLLLTTEKRKLLAQTQAKLLTVEEKWIKNEIKRDTYQRWHSEYTFEITSLKAAIDLFGKDQNEASSKIKRSLHLLTDIPQIFTRANSLQKRELISVVFDSNLYYENGVYRIPTMMEVLTHNTLKMKEKERLIYNKKEGFHEEIPPSAPEGTKVEPFAGRFEEVGGVV